MFTFNIDFSGDELSEKVGQRMKENTALKLRLAGLLDRVTVVYRENGHGVPVDFELEGLPEDVARAKGHLRIESDGYDDLQNQKVSGWAIYT